MLPVHRLEDDLAIDVAIEDQRRGVAIVGASRAAPGAPRAGRAAAATSVAPSMPRSTAPLLTMSEMDGGSVIGDRPGERIAAPGDQRHVNAGRDRGVNRVAILVRQPPVAVEQRAVNVDANQSNHGSFVSQRCGPAEADTQPS